MIASILIIAFILLYGATLIAVAHALYGTDPNEHHEVQQ